MNIIVMLYIDIRLLSMIYNKHWSNILNNQFILILYNLIIYYIFIFIIWNIIIERAPYWWEDLNFVWV